MRANELIKLAQSTGRGAASYKVVQEFISTALKKDDA